MNQKFWREKGGFRKLNVLHNGIKILESNGNL